jgi:hypothetical protein
LRADFLGGGDNRHHDDYAGERRKDTVQTHGDPCFG